MILRGIVRSGKGDFSFWIQKLEAFYSLKTGRKLFPGTLNVHLIDQTYYLPHNSLRLEKEEYGGRVSVSICPCKIFGRDAFILRTDTDAGKYGDPRESILEIASDVELREAYDLRDGDVVEVEVPEFEQIDDGA
jgi:CTP-dependent riboflavin kinase